MASAPKTSEPRRIGAYVVGERIAVGGMAEVFLAHRDADGAPRVLKVLLPRCARDEATVKGLAHEAELARVLVHPGIVRAYELVTDGDVTALVLELVDGTALDALLERPEGVTRGLALHVAMSVLDALAFVHAAKDEGGRSLDIVHRDVSPHNVLLSRTGDVKLVDFGIARSTLRDQRTRTGLVKGKLQYLSPEQATGSELDARTDVYALGMILYEMLAGRPYLAGASDVEVLRVAESPTYVPIGAERVEPRLEAVLKKSLARFPEERYASAKAFRAALAPFAPDEQETRAALASLVSAGAPSLLPPVVTEATPVTRARRARFSLFVAPVLAVSAVALYATRVSAPPHVEPTTTTTARADVVDARVEDAPRALDAAVLETRPVVRDAGRREAVVSPARVETPVLDASMPIARATISPAIVARRERLLASISARGLVGEDLGADAPRLMTELRSAIDDVDDSVAEAVLARLEGMLAAVRVDASLVRRRMARVDARIAEARARGHDTGGVEALSRAALEAFVEGRYDAASARLSEIDRALAASR